MKRVINILLILIILSSCKKEKSLTIAGLWRESANYIKTPSGGFSWESASRFPLMLTLTSNGQYYAFNDIPAGNGIYEYNYSTSQLKLEDQVSGNSNVYTVSFLDETYLIIDYFYNNELMAKVKFSR